MITTKPTMLCLFLLLVQFSGGNVFSQCKTLLWEEEFDGPGIDPEDWFIRNDDWGGGNNELQRYTDRDTNIFIQDGKLIIRALKETYDGRSYTSARLNTQGRHVWRYGRIEASIRLPEGKGIWPAFWMLPADNRYGGWPNSGEIDIMEMVGHEPATVWGTIHFGQPYAYLNEGYTLPGGKFSDGAHLFAIEWNRDSITWFVDDLPFSTRTAGDMANPDLWKVFREKFFLILNLAVGGNWPGSPDGTTKFPQTMEVDYIRVYGDPSQLEISTTGDAYPNARDVRYRIDDIPGAVFDWSVPAGAQITSGQGTHEIMVDWGCSTGEIGLAVTNLGCADQNYSLPVSFETQKLAGPEHLLPLEEAVYTVPRLLNTTYKWDYPEDVTVWNTPEDSMVLNWGCETGYLSVTMENECGSVSDSMKVTAREPLLSGTSTVATGATGIPFSIEAIPASTYEWSVPSGAVVSSGQGTPSVEIDFGTQSGVVEVTVNNSCGQEVYTYAVHISDTITLVDFEALSHDFTTFEGSTFQKVANPFQGAGNSSDHVGKTFKSTVAWSGIYMDLGYDLDTRIHHKFAMRVYGPRAGTVLFKLEDILGGGVQPVEMGTELTKTNAWEDLVWDFGNTPTDTWDRITLFFDFGSTVQNTYYFDDIRILAAGTGVNARMEGTGIQIYPNPARDLVHIETSDKGNPEIRITSAGGQLVYRGEMKGSNGQIDLSAFRKGVYFLTIRSGDTPTTRKIIKL